MLLFERKLQIMEANVLYKIADVIVPEDKALRVEPKKKFSGAGIVEDEEFRDKYIGELGFHTNFYSHMRRLYRVPSVVLVNVIREALLEARRRKKE